MRPRPASWAIGDHGQSVAVRLSQRLPRAVVRRSDLGVELHRVPHLTAGTGPAGPLGWVGACKRRSDTGGPLEGGDSTSRRNRVRYTRPDDDDAAPPAGGGPPAWPGTGVFRIQLSGASHLGNYRGAQRNYVALQDEYDAIYAIVDYHALTTVHDGEELRQLTRDMAP